MKYSIITLNDDRKAYKDVIMANVPYERVNVPAVDGKSVDLRAEIEGRSLTWSDRWPNAKKGEMGVWLSNFDNWAYASVLTEPLIVFEDDAIPSFDFKEQIEALIAELPEDWDFAALWVPENQRIDYRYEVNYDWAGTPRIHRVRNDWEQSQFDFGVERAALVYQGYGMVSLVYSPKGGKRLVELAREHQITGPVDCWLYEQAHLNNLKGYAPKPQYAEFVTYDWAAESHVQLTEKA